jgi:hypothetical protein
MKQIVLILRDQPNQKPSEANHVALLLPEGGHSLVDDLDEALKTLRIILRPDVQIYVGNVLHTDYFEYLDLREV